ncbi:MAG: hypothetical protein HFF73_03265 [Oscillospiraceae bacterium]|nr:hypothetical protein [Oscillospiraceae bacterium]
MKMKRIFSFTFAILLAVSASRPALAAENAFIPPEQELTEDVQIPEETLPPTDEDIPDDTLPPTDEETPDDTLPPTDEETPDDTLPPADEELPDDTLPPTDEQIPDDMLPPADEQIPDDLLPPADEQPVIDEDIIDVVVPAAGTVTLNPYRLPVDTDTGTTNEQVIYQPQEIINYSNFPVVVTAAAAGTLEGDAWLVSAPPAEDAASKELFLYAEFQSQPDLWDGGYTGAPNQLLINDPAKDVLLLDAGGVGYFRLSGSMTPYPQNMWSSDNALTVTISYTFARDPASIPAEPEIPDQFLDQGTEPPEEPEIPVIPEETENPVIPEETEVIPEEAVEPIETADPGDTVEPPGTPPPLEPYDIPAQPVDGENE